MPAKRSAETVAGPNIISAATNAEAGPSTPRQAGDHGKASSSSRTTSGGIEKEKHRPTVVYQLDGTQKSYETKLSRTAGFEEASTKAGKKLGLDQGVRLAHIREGGREVDILDQFDYDAFRSRAFAAKPASPVIIKVYPLAPPAAPAAGPGRLAGVNDARNSALAFIRQEALLPASSSVTNGAAAAETSTPVKVEKSKKAKKRRPSNEVAGIEISVNRAEPVIGHKRRRSSTPPAAQADPDGNLPAAPERSGSTSPPSKKSRKKGRKIELAPLLSPALPVRPGLAQRLSAVERYRPAVSSPLSRAIQASPLMAPTSQGMDDLAEIPPIGTLETAPATGPVTPPPPAAVKEIAGGTPSTKGRKPRKGRKSIISLPPNAQPIYGGIASSPTYRREGYSSSSIDSPPRHKVVPAAREIKQTPQSKIAVMPDVAPVDTSTPLVAPEAGPSQLPATHDVAPRQVKASRRASSAKKGKSAPKSASPAPGVRAPVAAGFLRQIVDDIFASYQQKKDVKGIGATPSPSPRPSSSEEVAAPTLPTNLVSEEAAPAIGPDEDAQDVSLGVQAAALQMPAPQLDELNVLSEDGPSMEQDTPMASSPVADPEPAGGPSDDVALDKANGQASTVDLPNGDPAPEATTPSPDETTDTAMHPQPEQPVIAEEAVKTVASLDQSPAAVPEDSTVVLEPQAENAMALENQPDAAASAESKGKTATSSSFAPLSVRERRGRPSRTPCLICQNGQHLQAECPTVKAGLPAIREALEARRADEKKDRDTDLAIEALEAWVTRLETISRKIRGEPPLPVVDTATPAAAKQMNGSQPVATVVSPEVTTPELVNATAAEDSTAAAKRNIAGSPAASAPPQSLQKTSLLSADTHTPTRKNRLVQPVVPDTNSRMPEIYRIAQSKSGSVSGMSASSALIESGSSDSGSSVTDSDSDPDSEDDSGSENDSSDSGSESASSEGDDLSDQQMADVEEGEETGADADSEDEEEAIAAGRVGVPPQNAPDVGDDGVEADDELDEEDNRDVGMTEPSPARPPAVSTPITSRTPKQSGAMPLAPADNEDDESATTDSETTDTATSVTTSRSPSPDRSRSPSMSGRSSAGSPVRYEDPHELMQRIMSQTLSRKDQRRARQSAVGMQDVVLSEAEGSNASDGKRESSARRDADSENDDDGSDQTPIKQPPPTQRRMRSASVSSIGDFEDGAAGLEAGLDGDVDVDMRDAEMDEILPSSLIYPPAFASADDQHESIIDEIPLEPAGTPPPMVPSSQSAYTPRTFRQLQRDAGTSPVIGDLDGSKAFEEARAEESPLSTGASMALPDTQTNSQQDFSMVPTQSTAEVPAPLTDSQPTKRMTRQTSRASAAPETVPEAEPQTPRPANTSLRRQTSATPRVEVTPRMRTRRSVSRDPSSQPMVSNGLGLGLGLGLALDEQAGGDTAPVTPKVTTYRTRRQAMLPSSQVDELESSQLVPPNLLSSGVPVDTLAGDDASAVEEGDNSTDMFHTPPDTVGPAVNTRLSRRSGQATQPNTPVGAGAKTRRASAASTARSSVPPSPVQLRRSSRRTASVSLEPPSPVTSKTPLAAARSPRALKPSSDIATSQTVEEQTPRQRRTPLFMEASQMPQTQAYNLLPSSMLDTQEQASAARRLNGLKSSSKASLRETSPIPEEESDNEREESYHSPEKQLSLQDVIPDTQLDPLPNGQGSPHAGNGDNGDTHEDDNDDDDARSEISEATASVAPSESDVEPDSPVLTPRPQIRPRASLGASQPAFSYPTLSSLSQSALRLGTSAYDRVTGLSGLGGRMSASQPVMGLSGLANGGAAHSRNGSAAGGRASTIFGTEDEDDGTTTDDSGSSSEDEPVPSARATAALAAAGGARSLRTSTGVNGAKPKVNGALKGRYAGEQKKKKTYGQVKGW